MSEYRGTITAFYKFDFLGRVTADGEKESILVPRDGWRIQKPKVGMIVTFDVEENESANCVTRAAIRVEEYVPPTPLPPILQYQL